jgi:hypothetical protein
MCLLVPSSPLLHALHADVLLGRGGSGDFKAVLTAYLSIVLLFSNSCYFLE